MVSRSLPYYPPEISLNVMVTPAPVSSVLPPVNNLITAFFIICGLFVVAKLFWMFWYQLKHGLGDEYLSGKLSLDDKKRLKKEFKGWKKLLKKE